MDVRRNRACALRDGTRTHHHDGEDDEGEGHAVHAGKGRGDQAGELGFLESQAEREAAPDEP